MAIEKSREKDRNQSKKAYEVKVNVNKTPEREQQRY